MSYREYWERCSRYVDCGRCEARIICSRFCNHTKQEKRFGKCEHEVCDSFIRCKFCEKRLCNECSKSRYKCKCGYLHCEDCDAKAHSDFNAESWLMCFIMFEVNTPMEDFLLAELSDPTWE